MQCAESGGCCVSTGTPTCPLRDAILIAKLVQFLFGCMDARRASDGRMVYLKRVRTDSEELSIATLFSQETARSDPTNHCVPILDVIGDEEEPTISYIVMPFLRHIDRPPFEGLGDIIRFVDHMLEVSPFQNRVRIRFADFKLKGLTFMHQHGVAHRYVDLV